MEGLRASGFVNGDNLITEVGPYRVTIEGEIACLGGIVVNVLKTLEVLRGEGLDAVVQTVTYAYNASVRNGFNVFRYDNLHRFKGHPDSHHKHTYDWLTGEEVAETPEPVGAEGWPSLTDVIVEAQKWHGDHYDELENPDKFPELAARG